VSTITGIGAGAAGAEEEGTGEAAGADMIGKEEWPQSDAEGAKRKGAGAKGGYSKEVEAVPAVGLP
jgi:hypothetical protein